MTIGFTVHQNNGSLCQQKIMPKIQDSHLNQDKYTMYRNTIKSMEPKLKCWLQSQLVQFQRYKTWSHKVNRRTSLICNMRNYSILPVNVQCGSPVVHDNMHEIELIYLIIKIFVHQPSNIICDLDLGIIISALNNLCTSLVMRVYRAIYLSLQLLLCIRPVKFYFHK